MAKMHLHGLLPLRRAGLILAGCLTLLSAGCDRARVDGDSARDRAQDSTSSTAATQAPPGFLDPAPPGPESDTVILSGGTLLGNAVADEYPQGLFDAVVVLRDGILIAYGKRGAVEVPADSIGVDTSGKFIVPTPPFVRGQPATVQVLETPPSSDGDPRPPGDVYSDGRWIPQPAPAK